MNLQELKIRVYKSNLALVERGLVLYTWGNVSAIDRETGRVVIKPRGVPYEELRPDDLPVTDLQGVQLEGALLPSVDLDIHLELYRRVPAIGAVAHTHSTWATAWAQAGRSIPVLGTTHGDHFYGEIPCVRQLAAQEVDAGYERALGQVIADALAGYDPMQVPAVLARAHGPFTWGSTPEAAVEHSVILEELAKMAKLTEDIAHSPQQLPRYLLDKHYLRKYGPDAYFYQDKPGGSL